MTKKYGVVLKEKYGVDGLTKDDVVEMFDKLSDDEAFPIELSAREHESSAMGFITDAAANVLDYDYERSGFHDFIALILDDMNNESKDGTYKFGPLNICLSR